MDRSRRTDRSGDLASEAELAADLNALTMDTKHGSSQRHRASDWHKFDPDHRAKLLGKKEANFWVEEFPPEPRANQQGPANRNGLPRAIAKSPMMTQFANEGGGAESLKLPPAQRVNESDFEDLVVPDGPILPQVDGRAHNDLEQESIKIETRRSDREHKPDRPLNTESVEWNKFVKDRQNACFGREHEHSHCLEKLLAEVPERERARVRSIWEDQDQLHDKHEYIERAKHETDDIPRAGHPKKEREIDLPILSETDQQRLHEARGHKHSGKNTQTQASLSKGLFGKTTPSSAKESDFFGPRDDYMKPDIKVDRIPIPNQQFLKEQERAKHTEWATKVTHKDLPDTESSIRDTVSQLVDLPANIDHAHHPTRKEAKGHNLHHKEGTFQSPESIRDQATANPGVKTIRHKHTKSGEEAWKRREEAQRFATGGMPHPQKH